MDYRIIYKSNIFIIHNNLEVGRIIHSDHNCHYEIGSPFVCIFLTVIWLSFIQSEWTKRLLCMVQIIFKKFNYILNILLVQKFGVSKIYFWKQLMHLFSKDAVSDCQKIIFQINATVSSKNGEKNVSWFSQNIEQHNWKY